MKESCSRAIFDGGHPFRALVALFLIMIQGCAHTPANIETRIDPSYAFSKAHSWDFSGGTMTSDAARKTQAHLALDSLVFSEIQRALESRGLKQSGHQPDLHVSYRFGEWAIDTHQKPNGGYGADGPMFPGAHGSLLPNESDGRVPPPSKDPYSSRHEEAQLEISITDAASNKVVFNARMTNERDFGYFRSAQRDEIESAIREMLSRLP